MKHIDVTISIVSYNTKEYTARCIASIISYTKNITYEIIVVDNGSKDKTPEYIRSKFKSVKLIKNKRNNYYGGANNQALKIARGKYFLILNADTYFTNNSVKKIVSFMDQNEKVGALEGLEIYENGVLLPNGSMNVTPLLDFYELSFVGKYFKDIKKINKFRLSSKDRRETFEVEVGCDAFLAVRTELLKKIGGYDEKLLLYYTENDLCMRIIKSGYKIVHFGKAHVYHKVSVSANKLKWKKLDLYYKDLYSYYKKNGFVFLGTFLFIELHIEKIFLQLFRPNMFEK